MGFLSEYQKYTFSNFPKIWVSKVHKIWGSPLIHLWCRPLKDFIATPAYQTRETVFYFVLKRIKIQQNLLIHTFLHLLGELSWLQNNGVSNWHCQSPPLPYLLSVRGYGSFFGCQEVIFYASSRFEFKLPPLLKICTRILPVTRK